MSIWAVDMSQNVALILSYLSCTDIFYRLTFREHLQYYSTWLCRTSLLERGTQWLRWPTMGSCMSALLFWRFQSRNSWGMSNAGSLEIACLFSWDYICLFWHALEAFLPYTNVLWRGLFQTQKDRGRIYLDTVLFSPFQRLAPSHADIGLFNTSFCIIVRTKIIYIHHNTVSSHVNYWNNIWYVYLCNHACTSWKL